MSGSDRARLARYLPLLVGELAVGSAAIAAITLTVEEPSYEPLIHGALVLALGLSAYNTARRRAPTLPGALVFLTAFVLYGARHYLGRVALLFFPGEVSAQQDALLAGLMAWFLVAFACWQSTGRNLIFMVVCGLAIFGLMGTINLNAELLVAFAVFVCASIFCWGYEQFLALSDRATARAEAPPEAWLAVARGQLAVALLVGILTLGLGGLIGAGVYRVTPNLYATMAQRAYGWDVSARVQRLFNSFDSSFRVGAGPVRLSNVPVMQVAADRAALWRGAAYDYYDGDKWRRSPGRWSPLLPAPNGGLSVPPELLPPSQSQTMNRQRVTPVGATSLLFAAAQPVWVDLGTRPPTATPGLAPRAPSPAIDVFGCLAGTLGTSTSYTVVSQEPTTDPALLRQCPGEYEPRDFEPYLQLPSSTVSLLKPLATRLTADAATPYDKVAALQQYVERTCLYTLKARAVPAGADAVDYFLNHSKRGACDLFSSSLAVLCRLAGVPARVATGYASGAYNADAGVFEVRGTDAHAWTEVFFHGYGWVPFDPQAVTNYDEETLVQLLTNGHFAVAIREGLYRLFIIAVAVGLVVLALSALVDPLQWLRRLGRRPARTPLARACAEYQSLCALLLRLSGLQLAPGLTPQEVMAAVAQSLPRAIHLDRRRLLAVNARFYEVRYSEGASYADLASLRAEVAAIRRQLRRRR